ncbi:citrate/2-methylcitrate synthase [Anaerovorax odorimutans]|uniref:citrate/2-methylcitrate synthase n=1 Tax=Anaerovorax odorimutans TaxID=109327 RepID=UPI000427C022|nr:citrate/2-methylcitrate synthase [Anaerovorax odorimutans]
MKDNKAKKSKSIIKPTTPFSKERERYFYTSMSKMLAENNVIENSLYGKFNVKRGLRDPNGAGVLVGLTHISDVQGYEVDSDGKKVAIPGKLYYRGIDIEDIVTNCLKEDRFGYEETSYLLLFGQLPNKKQLETYTALLGSKRDLPLGFSRDMILTAPSKSVMNKLARSVLALYSYDNNPDDISIRNVLRQSISLIGHFPSLIAYGYQAKQSYFNNQSLHLHYSDPSKSTAENILRLIRPTGEYTDLEAKLLDICLILHAEHGGGNNSSFTTHLVSSSGTDTYSAIAAAVGSLKGPKHGGANIEVIEMINNIKANVKDITNFNEVEKYLIKILNGEANDKSGLIYGLGHAVYTISDPRAGLLKSMAKKLAKDKGLMEDFILYDFIEKRAPELFQEVKGVENKMPANVDLYSGFVYSALNIPIDIATPIFATSRISGWCAHRIEELVAGGRIMRPAYKCVQSTLPYVKLDQR